MKKQYNKPQIITSNLNFLNKELPIRFPDFQQIINNISAKYPYAKKSEISIIIKAFLEEIREQLVRGNVINIRNFLPNMRMHSYAKLRQDKIVINTRVQVTTTTKIKSKK